jgi:hypothetical protein
VSRVAGVDEVCFVSHEGAVRACKSALLDWFDLFEEVRLSSNQLADKPLKVDLLAVPKADEGWIIGLEVKRGFYRMSEYSHAIKQAADYRLGSISDPRHPALIGRRVCGAFVFPRWHGGHDNAREYHLQGVGMEILSHHFRVGFADFDGGAITLMMNDRRLWQSGNWSGNAAGVLGGKERIGSLRLTDPAKLTT